MEIGQQVGDYIVEAELGGGGMATVYRVRHKVLDTIHALKVLAEKHRASADIRRRFLDEAKVQAKHLLHPNIVRVTNIIATADVAALVMDLVDGGSLDDYLTSKKQPLSADELLAIAIPILDAMSHAHDAGIVHRDLKPANVLLRTSKGRLVPTISDFGIAKLTDPATTGSKRSTHHDASMGTLGYSSPEQIVRAKDATPRSDIFSLGAMFYEMATGRAPFTGNSDFEIMEKIVHSRFDPPEQHADPAMPHHISAAISRALESNPARRFASCRDFCAALTTRDGPVAAPQQPRKPPALIVEEGSEDEDWLENALSGATPAPLSESAANAKPIVARFKKPDEATRRPTRQGSIKLVAVVASLLLLGVLVCGVLLWSGQQDATGTPTRAIPSQGPLSQATQGGTIGPVTPDRGDSFAERTTASIRQFRQDLVATLGAENPGSLATMMADEVFMIGPRANDLRTGAGNASELLIDRLEGSRATNTWMFGLLLYGDNRAAAWFDLQFGSPILFRMTAAAELASSGWRIAALDLSRALTSREERTVAAQGGPPTPLPLPSDDIPAMAKDLARVAAATLTSTDAFAGSFSSNSSLTLLGSAPSERYVGADNARSAIRSWRLQLQRGGPMRVGIIGDGELGWVATTVAATSAGARSGRRTTYYRTMLVYQKEAQRWRLVQAHFSNELR